MVEAYTVIPLSPIRKVIAARMIEAARSIPHFRLVARIDVDPLLQLREELRTRNPGATLSLNDLFIKGCAAVLTEVPEINVQWAEDGIRQYKTADISVVMAIAGGLATPIVRRANEKSVWDIALEVRELGQRAVRNGLKMDEIVGGTFSVSNLGMFGVDQFDAIINPPQCAILAIGAAKPTILVTSDGEQRIASTICVTLSCDHRAIDGATGARFLSVLRTCVENPDPLRFCESRGPVGGTTTE